MQKLKSNLPNMVGVLTTVAVLCGGILAYVNNLTAAPRQQAADQALNAGIEQVMCGKCKIENTDTIKRVVDGKKLTYIAYKTDKGTAIQSTDPNGFGGNLTVLVGFNEAGDILGYTILETTETPGLGAKADKWFQKGEKGDIIGKNPAEPLTVSKDCGQVDAITASTITSRAFLLAVNKAYKAFKATPIDKQ
jgi:electron transport complex protein RnfG